ncbi:B-type cyclin [Seminavis robusta]|uniref:B-type cyclin n=1 Tax=Seminavis robusta TaxID=568900 RepID=A0A9N8DRZ2_9STRA|nr:B-type cyclin [Seminavis robusta]|eukprot:Sro326_g118260.1 B-type cyclin (392) ;mRNA; r:71449-72708
MTITLPRQPNASTAGYLAKKTTTTLSTANSRVPFQEVAINRNRKLFSPSLEQGNKKRFKSSRSDLSVKPQARPLQSRPFQAKPSSRSHLSAKPQARPLQSRPFRAKPIADIDKDDQTDPLGLAATVYAKEIFQNLREREVTLAPNPNYLSSGQPKICAEMLSILIDWLISVHERKSNKSGLEGGYSPETIYLTSNILHRFLSSVDIEREELQLVGVTAFFIASKYEDIYPPSLKELCCLCDDFYTEQQLLDMEVVILKTLEYRVSAPTSLNFLERFLKASKADSEMKSVACYMLDGTLLSYELLQYRPSELAAAAVFIARSNNTSTWNRTMEFYTGFNKSKVQSVAKTVVKMFRGTPLRAVHNKYARSRHGKVSLSFDFDSLCFVNSGGDW